MLEFSPSVARAIDGPPAFSPPEFRGAALLQRVSGGVRLVGLGDGLLGDAGNTEFVGVATGLEDIKFLLKHPGGASGSSPPRCHTRSRQVALSGRSLGRALSRSKERRWIMGDPPLKERQRDSYGATTLDPARAKSAAQRREWSRPAASRPRPPGARVARRVRTREAGGPARCSSWSSRRCRSRPDRAADRLNGVPRARKRASPRHVE